jgi:hypothetical protein
MHEAPFGIGDRTFKLAFGITPSMGVVLEVGLNALSPTMHAPLRTDPFFARDLLFFVIISGFAAPNSTPTHGF